MSNYIDDSVIEEIRDRVSIVDLINEYVPLKKSGANYVGLCPFHSEKTPSFHVAESNQFYHCFGCGAGGDIFEFIKSRENLDFTESVKFLAEKYGIEIREATREERKAQTKKERSYEINREAAGFFLNNLAGQRIPRAYLEKRAIDYRLSRKFGLGYALDSWDGLYKHLSSKGYKEEELEALGLIGRRKDGNGYYDRFRNRLIFPIIDTRSRVIGFGGRVLDDSMPKYLNSKETIVFNKGDNLYGLNMLDKYSNRESIILVEGYMDVISLFSNGIYSGVASLGTAFTARQAQLLKRYGRKVYICYDSDLAGIKATNKAIEILLKEDIKPHIISLGEYKDPDDYFKDHKKKDFMEAMEAALNFIDFKIKVSEKKYNLGDIDGKIAFTREISRELGYLKNPIEKDVYINDLSEKLNIDKDAIKAEVMRASSFTRQADYSKAREQARPASQRAVLQRADLTAEIELVRLMILDKKYYEIIVEKDIFSYFENDSCVKTINILNNMYKTEDFIEKKKIYDIMQCGPGEANNVLDQILDDRITFTSDNISKAIEDLIVTLKISNLDRQRQLVRDRIKELENTTSDIDFKKLSEFLDELVRLNAKLDSIKSKDRG